MPVNPYDGRKVSLPRQHGNSDLDIVRASYTRRKANVNEALSVVIKESVNKLVFILLTANGCRVPMLSLLK